MIHQAPEKDRVREVFGLLEDYRAGRGLSMNRVARHLGLGGKELTNMAAGATDSKALKTLGSLEAYMGRPDEVVKLQESLDGSGAPRSAAAKALHMSDSQLSQVLRGLYPSYSAKHRQVILHYLWLQEARAEGLGEGEFQRTQNARILFNACRFAQAQRSCAIVIGEAGCGKTIIGRRYKHEHPGTIFVDTYMKMPPTAVLYSVHKTVTGFKRLKARKDEVFWGVTDRLRSSDRLIIIDEANQLTTDSLQTIRNVADHAGLGLVLLGTDLLWHTLYGLDPTRTGEFAQLFSRAVKYELVKASKKDTELLIKDFVKNPSEAIIKAFHEYGNKSPRSMSKLLGLAHDLAKDHGGRITPTLIEEASKKLIFGVAGDLKRLRRKR